eukprot:2400599-Lingulodinium_polyedra.AAC.1
MRSATQEAEASRVGLQGKKQPRELACRPGIGPSPRNGARRIIPRAPTGPTGERLPPPRNRWGA